MHSATATEDRARTSNQVQARNLKQRSFRYPCGFLIYSDALDALPAAAKERVYRGLWDVLTGQNTSKDFAGLSRPDRETVLEILLDTKSGLPEYWRKPRVD